MQELRHSAQVHTSVHEQLAVVMCDSFQVDHHHSTSGACFSAAHVRQCMLKCALAARLERGPGQRQGCYGDRRPDAGLNGDPVCY